MRHHLSSANVLSSLALFAALGGGAYAAGLARDSVGSRELRPNAVRASELSSRGFARELGEATIQWPQVQGVAVSGAQIADQTVTRADLGFPVLGREEFGAAHSEATDEVQLTKDTGFVTVAKTTLTAPATFDIFLDGAVQAANPANAGTPPAQLELRMVRDGDHVHGLTFKESIGGSETGTVPISLQCNEVPPGTHTVELQARVLDGSALTVTSRSLEAIRFGPIFSPPGR